MHEGLFLPIPSNSLLPSFYSPINSQWIKVPPYIFFLVEYPVPLKNTSDYTSKITCEVHDFNFIALYSHSMPTIVSFIKGLKDFHEILFEHLVLWGQHGSVCWPQREESTSTWLSPSNTPQCLHSSAQLKVSNRTDIMLSAHTLHTIGVPLDSICSTEIRLLMPTGNRLTNRKIALKNFANFTLRKKKNTEKVHLK